MKRIVLMLIVMVAFAVNADAQGFLKRLKDRAINAAENAVERKVERKVDRTTEDAMDNVLGDKKNEKSEKSSKKNKKSKNNDADDEEDEAEVDEPQAQTGAAKSDFVRGGVVMFEDNVQGEQVGEFPSKWDLVRGNAEIATVNGQTCIAFLADDSWISPLVKGGIKNYLGDVFTVEYDMLYKQKGGADPDVELDIMHESMNRDRELFSIEHHFHYEKTGVNCDYVRPTEQSWDHKEGNARAHDVARVNDGRWHHYALSFNKRAIKFYVDGKRVINVPNAKAGAGWLTLFVGHGTSENPVYMRNVVIAKGAVELYQRQETDIDAKVAAIEKSIAETGKFVTNNILFETGKATLKQESMTEIQRVAEYMKKNPSARFEVQGHTDNQGSDKINDPLSQQRAEAVVKALEGLGVDGFNLRAVGKGSHEPVADNKTDEGRAKNRRVEFIKK